MQQESIALLLPFRPPTLEPTQAAIRAATMIDIAPDVRVPRGALPLPELRSFLRTTAAAIPLDGKVSVLLTTDDAIRELNRQFRRKNKPTDVLSFPPAQLEDTKNRLAGDLAISVDTAARQADEWGHSLLTEVKILLLHGLLHLAGLDHERDEGQMRRREQTLRVRLGLPSGLILRSGERAPASSTARRKAGAR